MIVHLHKLVAESNLKWIAARNTITATTPHLHPLIKQDYLKWMKKHCEKLCKIYEAASSMLDEESEWRLPHDSESDEAPGLELE